MDQATHNRTIEWRKTDKPEKKEIVVDGIVWANTWQTGHGMHGKTYTFDQINGGTITQTIKGLRGDREREIVVRSINKRDDDRRPTEQRIIDKVNELIDAGMLMHPDQKAQQNEQELAIYRRQREEEQKAADAAFRAKAIEAIGAPECFKPNEAGEAMIARIIDAMKWAQTQ